jgi:pimeloyl-ACP methyl ester carboxylesterase
VVIGESLGGSIALVALEADPTDFAGLVLLDSPYPGYIDNELDLASPDPEGTWLAIGENPERLDIIESFRQVVAPAEPPEIPIVVVRHGTGDPPMACLPCPSSYPVAALEAAWQEGQVDLAEALGARLVIAEDTGHSIAGENPGLVVQIVSEAIAAVRDSAGSGRLEPSPSA